MGVRAPKADGTLGTYQFLTYNECNARAHALGSAMKTRDLVKTNSEVRCATFHFRSQASVW